MRCHTMRGRLQYAARMDLFLPGPAGRLEAKLWEPDADASPKAAIVFCHPHPLGGGTMDNKVVFRAARGLQKAGLAVLRFDFRGVRRSEGKHDGTSGEIADLGAALDWMQTRFPAVELWAGGFSFGSRIAAARAVDDVRIKRLVLVALPVLAFDVSYIARVTQPGFVLMAEKDEYGTLAELNRRFPEVMQRFETSEVPGVGHFFDDKTLEVQSRVQAYAERVLQKRT
jgi:alpha/beta superfamily hydrolase